MKELINRTNDESSFDHSNGLFNYRDCNELDNDDDGSLDCSFDFADRQDENDKEGKLLTSLVRRTYLRHLRMCLLSNYENWWQCYGGGVEMSDTVIARCANELEKKALRKCMMTNIYQRCIVDLIKNIKKSTEKKELDEDLFLALNSGLKKCDKSVQVGPGLDAQSLLNGSESRLPSKNNMLSSFNSVDSVNLSLNLNSTPNQSNSLGTPFLQQSSETNFPAPLSTEMKYNIDCIPFFEDNLYESTPVTNPVVRPIKRKSIQNTSMKRIKASLEPQRKPLEERIKKFEEIFGESFETPSVGSHSSLREKESVEKTDHEINFTKYFLLINWKSESVAQICELNKKLSSLTPFQRSRLKLKFTELFGVYVDDNDDPRSMTPEDFGHCRKRTANLVVAELTPNYEQGKISSRVVFKALAKEITSVLLTDSYAAGFEHIKAVVEECFQNDNKFTNLQEVSHMFTR